MLRWMGLAALAAAVLATGAGAQNEPQPLKVGDKAPDFKLVGTDGKEYTLRQFQGKSWIAIAWYPRALTGG